MKNLLTILFVFCITTVIAQESSSFHKALQIKIDLLPLAYDYSRLGIVIEKKLERYSIYAGGQYGTNLDMSQLVDDPNGHYSIWALQAGFKRIFPETSGEYFFGLKAGYDKSKKYYSGDVYYDIAGEFAVLYDGAYYTRSRISLFGETGYEFFIGKRLSIELTYGIGIVNMENGYNDVNNPFQLEDVPPREIRHKTRHKYVRNTWYPAVNGGVKLGWRI